MNNALPLSEEKKLSVIYRVEAGCLGPQGTSHISAFCNFAQTELQPLASDCITWDIIPRHDKALAEMQYILAGKNISDSQAKRYLALFDKNLDEIEDTLGDTLGTLINTYMNQ